MTATAARARRIAAQLALLAAAAVVAWKAVVLGLGDLYLGSDAAFVAKLDKGNADAALALARQAGAAAPADAAAARAQARDALHAALAARPADGRLLRALARLEPEDAAQAQRRWQAAALLRPADVEARAWLADSAVARGDYATALAHCDAVLRVAPARAATLFPLLAQWLASGAGTAALGQTLAQRPPWRRAFVDYMARTTAEGSIYPFAQIVQSLRGSAAPLDADEARGLVNRLVRDRDFERAYLLWRSLLPPLGTATGMLYNGGFELPASGAAFDWTLRATPGVSVAQEDGGAAHGQVLRLRFKGARVAGIGVEQTLLLPRGSYALLGEARLHALRGAGALEWRVDCLSGQPRVIAAAPVAVQVDQDWSTFEFALDVPAADCIAQRLQLAPRGAAAAAPEGMAWFDNLRIEARGTAAPQAGRSRAVSPRPRKLAP